MKCAAAKTWLSFATATLNSLRLATLLPPFEQDDEDGGRREVGGGARIPGVSRVAEPVVERRERRAAGLRAHAARGEHAVGLPGHRRGGRAPALSRDVRVRSGGEPPPERPHDGVPSGEP